MQDYKEQTKEELLVKIEALNRLNKELLKTFQETERLEFGWSGNLGQWFWDFTTNEVTFNPLKAEAIGYMKEDLPEKVPYEFFTDKVHPDDKDMVMDSMMDHLYGKIPVWEVKYRIQAKDGSWKVYKDRGKVTERTEDGKPLFLKGIVFDVTKEEKEREDLMVKNKTLKNQMKQDVITSLYSRSAILLEFAKYANRAKKQDQPLSMIVMNIDKYPLLEEEYGIILSEEVLKETGKIIKTTIQDKYSAGRYREAVFLILLENTDTEEAYDIAETIRQMVSDSFFAIPRRISVSSGVSLYKSTETVSEFIQKTTQKLYAAQTNGGNQTIL